MNRVSKSHLRINELHLKLIVTTITLYFLQVAH